VKEFVLKLSFCECGVHERDLLSEERTTEPEKESMRRGNPFATASPFRMVEGIVEVKHC
jgi:hypothetical protein